MYNIKYIKYNNLVFIETHKMYIISSLGSVKTNLTLRYRYILEGNVLFIKNKELLVFRRTQETINFLTELLRSNLYGTIGKLKIIGLGYKLLFSNNLWVFKLGYSHLIYKNLSLRVYTKKKKKKKKYVAFGRILKYKVDSFSNEIQGYRVPDPYSANGIFKRLTKVVFKKKKALLF